MKTIGTILQSLGAIVLSVFGLQMGSAKSTPAASFQVSPPNPVVGASATFIDSSLGSPTAWSWDFGDGSGSLDHNPTHTYAAPGHYTVTLRATNASGSNSTAQVVVVTVNDTLRLNAAGGHAFLATISARDQRTGNTGSGLALAQTDVFGYFSLPALTNNPDNPEVFVKVLDGTFLNGHYWVFYGGLTDLEYTLKIEDELTGASKSYLKPAGSAEGGFDTAAFTGSGAGSTSAWLEGQTALSSWLSGAPSLFAQARPKDVSSTPLIDVQPANPAAGQITQMDLENLPTGPRVVVWTLAPGVTSRDRQPIYTYTTPGTHHVTANDLLGARTYSTDLIVSPSDTLRLLPSSGTDFQEIQVRLTARDPRTYRIGHGLAYANNKLYGSFSIPDLTNNPSNAEMIVKSLDGRPINGNFWVFYGGLTDMQTTIRADYKLSTSLTISKFYFKDSGSKVGGFDTGGFSNAELPSITSISPTSGPFGTTIRLLGHNLYGSKIEPFFDDSVDHLKNEKYPLRWIAGGIDPASGLNYMDVQPTNPLNLTSSTSLQMPISLVVDGYLATAPVPFTLNFSGTPTTPTPPVTTVTPVPVTATPTFPGPTATPQITMTPIYGAPVITGTSLDNLTVGTVFDIFGNNLGNCSQVTVFLQNANGTHPLTCQFGDSQSIQVQVPTGTPTGTYHTCVMNQMGTGCTSWNMTVM